MLSMNSSVLAKKNSNYKTPIHQDYRSIQGSLNSIVVWIPLMDVNKSCGSIKIIKGSHKRGLLDTEKDEWYRKIKKIPPKSDFIDIDMNKGDALFFSTFLIHKSGSTKNKLIRWTAQYRFNDADEKHFISRNYYNPYKVIILDKLDKKNN